MTVQDVRDTISSGLPSCPCVRPSAPFTAKDMTLLVYTRTKRSCLMNEGLALARYHDNYHQVQCQLQSLQSEILGLHSFVSSRCCH